METHVKFHSTKINILYNALQFWMSFGKKVQQCFMLKYIQHKLVSLITFVICENKRIVPHHLHHVLPPRTRGYNTTRVRDNCFQVLIL